MMNYLVFMQTQSKEESRAIKFSQTQLFSLCTFVSTLLLLLLNMAFKKYVICVFYEDFSRIGNILCELFVIIIIMIKTIIISLCRAEVTGRDNNELTKL